MYSHRHSQRHFLVPSSKTFLFSYIQHIFIVIPSAERENSKRKISLVPFSSDEQLIFRNKSLSLLNHCQVTANSKLVFYKTVSSVLHSSPKWLPKFSYSRVSLSTCFLEQDKSVSCLSPVLGPTRGKTVYHLR